jgi:hypothetical protein
MSNINNNLDFLPEKAPKRQRDWHVNNNVFIPVLCKACQSNLVKWSNQLKGYRRFCSSKCAHNDSEVKEKTASTCMEKYGSSSNLSSVEGRKKIQETWMHNYGVDNPFKSEAVQQKIKATNIEKYGVENPAVLPETKSKIDQTHINRYGRKRSSQSHISQESYEAKNNKEMMLNMFATKKLSVTEIADILGVGHSQLGLHFKNNLGIDISRHNVSSIERQVVDYVKSILPDTEIITSDRTIIKPKELDVVIPSKKIAIEIHGLSWHSELCGKGPNYHLAKMQAANSAGYRLIQLTDAEWINSQSLVKSRLSVILGANNITKIHARKCKVVDLTNNDCADFLSKNHIQGNAVSKINLGLMTENDLVAVMTFGRPRFNKENQWELIRFACNQYYCVVGGASKLLTHFIKSQVPDSIISYCDLRWNTGDVYRKLGFVYERDTSPNYWYTKYKTLENRTKYQKHKLEKILPTYDPLSTEWDNMQANKFDRFWDCGSSVYVWKQQTSC